VHCMRLLLCSRHWQPVPFPTWNPKSFVYYKSIKREL
jgi:hypothetical protein